MLKWPAPLAASRLVGVASVAAGLLTGACPTFAAEPPSRIVSLNVCVDQVLVDLVPRERIAAVTHLATDPLSSPYPERAAGLAVTHGSAEDVLAREPDLVIAGAYTTPATVDLLRRLGRNLLVVPLPNSIAGIRDVIMDIATAAGVADRGHAMIATLDRRLAAVAGAPPDDRAPTALVYQANSYVSGTGDLVDEALHRAGWRNGAAQLLATRSGQLSLEALVTAPPDLLILASAPDAYRTAVADNLRHPALLRLREKTPSLILPWPLWLCGTQHIAEAVERLAAARRDISSLRTRSSNGVQQR